MMYSQKALLYGVLCLFFGVPFGCRKAGAKTSYAVVVGISDYKISDYRTGDLRYADQDARRFGDFLKSAAGGSVPAQNIKLLTNREATKSAILQAMSLFGKATPQDRVVFYFSGHGMKGGFLPYDVSATDPTTILNYQEVKARFKPSVSLTKLCIADACLSGGMTARTAWKGPASKTSTSSNVVLMLSSRSTQSSVESGARRGGIFTFYVLKGLRGEADSNRNRTVTIRELYDYVSPLMRRSTPNRQAPLFYGKFSDELPLSKLQ
ncbi:caspase family protein [Salmonirosea aquatica]|uniref:Caspase family protein n=1 Tax=Salmonirosea aquatica TaxID=2654236 RepID=A0A7C9FX61_9BACT|nr:caspase family protein [Cytophagaceae bacterium SJW1-29]